MLKRVVLLKKISFGLIFLSFTILMTQPENPHIELAEDKEIFIQNKIPTIAASWKKLLSPKWDTVSNEDLKNIFATLIFTVGGVIVLKFLLRSNSKIESPIFNRDSSVDNALLAVQQIESANTMILSVQQAEYNMLVVQVQNIINTAKKTNSYVNETLNNRFGIKNAVNKFNVSDPLSIKIVIINHLMKTGTPVAMCLLRDLEQINYGL